jgi:hypothetical protein
MNDTFKTVYPGQDGNIREIQDSEKLFTGGYSPCSRVWEITSEIIPGDGHRLFIPGNPVLVCPYMKSDQSYIGR